MKNKYQILLLLVFLINNSFPAMAQDIMMHTQGILKQEFFNPAYNSFKDYASFSLLNKYQWTGSMNGAPKTYAVNAYIPVKLSGLGFGITAITEEIGLRNKVSFTGNLSHNVKVGENGYLAFGYGIGMQNISYNTQKMKTYEGSEITSDINSTDYNFALGMFYYGNSYFAGLSTNVLVSGTDYTGGQILPGVDVTTGYVHRFSESLLLKPEMILKYYPVRSTYYQSAEASKSRAKPVLDLGINALLMSRMWLGTSFRIKQAWTFSADVIIKDAFKLGYTFEWGVGKGINQFNSHGIRLVWNLIPSYALKGFNRSSRYKGAIIDEIYR